MSFVQCHEFQQLIYNQLITIKVSAGFIGQNFITIRWFWDLATWWFCYIYIVAMTGYWCWCYEQIIQRQSVV